MDPRHIPTRWLMTDERLGERLFEAIARVPRGGGVMFRHDSLGPAARAALAGAVAELCARRGLVLGVAADAALARRLGARFVHRPVGDSAGVAVTMPVHDAEEARAASAAGAAAVFVSPLFATRSHPGGGALGPHRAAELAAIAGVPGIALGGMDEARFAALDGFHGWAGIDAWLAA
ncbi:thiamine phosphate synthase [Sphingomonas sp. ASV193]|uniref:thiamine phosphate synthase n=1 Tax=Sphingomonas sp. ASV193 TaxID=3144405 RepID=UPI0032E8A5B2